MAKLIPPTKATRYKRSTEGNWSKYHLLNANTSNPDPLAICGKILTPGWYPEMDTQDIGKILASDLCRKCLGAMTAED